MGKKHCSVWKRGWFIKRGSLAIWLCFFFVLLVFLHVCEVTKFAYSIKPWILLHDWSCDSEYYLTGLEIKKKIAFWRLLKKKWSPNIKMQSLDSTRTETQIRAPFNWHSCSASGTKHVAKTSSGSCCMKKSKDVLEGILSVYIIKISGAINLFGSH